MAELSWSQVLHRQIFYVISGMHAIRLPFHFDAARLRAEIEVLPEGAYEEIASSYITRGGLWGINLLVPDASRHVGEDDAPLVASPWLRQLPVTAALLAHFESPKSLARIHKLQPGGRIFPHTDSGRYELGGFRVHVPVVASAGAEFVVEDKKLNMEAGECWYIDVARTHHVQHKGAAPRIHIVIDFQRNAWWDAVFHALGKAPVAEGPYARMRDADLEQMRAQIAEMADDGALAVLQELEAELARRKALD